MSDAESNAPCFNMIVFPKDQALSKKKKHVWLVVWNIFYFPINIGFLIIPTHIFQVGVAQPPTRCATQAWEAQNVEGARLPKISSEGPPAMALTESPMVQLPLFEPISRRKKTHAQAIYIPYEKQYILV